MAKAKEKVESITPMFSTGGDKEGNPYDTIQTRRTQELVIAFCGPLGSGVSTVAGKLKEILEDQYNYKAKRIKISEFIEKEFLKKNSIDKLEDTHDRFRHLQKTGNNLREKYDHDILAELAIKEIYLKREEEIAKKEGTNPLRLVYIVEGLKNPAEVRLLEAVYGNMFYLIGVLCAHQIRLGRLVGQKLIEASKAENLMKIDKTEGLQKHGQQLIGTLQHADFFIRNNHSNPTVLMPPLTRYVDLILGKTAITPTKHEYGMYVAQSAALNSACLSRQVGASILNQKGEVISTGCNDVPKKGGGYSALKMVMMI